MGFLMVLQLRSLDCSFSARQASGRGSRVWSGVRVQGSVQGSGPEFSLEFGFGVRIRVQARVPSSV